MMMKTKRTLINRIQAAKTDKEAREIVAKSNKNKLMKFLPRAMTFQNRPHFSPGPEPKLPPRLSDAYKNRSQAAQNRGFSGPLISLVPIGARGHNNKKGKERDGGGFDSDVEEPRSPKVSCIGQIKQKKKLHELKKDKSKKIERLEVKPVDKKRNPNSGGFGNIFRRRSKPNTAEKVEAPPPGLSQMKRFSSGRDAFVNFDWTKQQVAPVDRECYSDDEEQRRRDWDEEEEEEDFGGGVGSSDVMIPFSAPMMIGGGDVMRLEPRKEICLWKKRNMAPPKPLKLNTFSR